MARKALIVYGTRFGATAGTSEEIANVLRSNGIDVTVVNARKQKVKDISPYDLVIVGSGMMIDRWTGQPEKFLKRFQKQLAGKKVALFVSSGGMSLLEREGKTAELERTRRKYLEEKAAKYSLQPVALAMFGGVWDFNHQPWWSGMAMTAIRKQIEDFGLQETEPGVYDTRDWNAIRDWAGKLSAQA